jgi:fermentation-respiration switch protein FrsA (DUF1100 family)
MIRRIFIILGILLGAIVALAMVSASLLTAPMQTVVGPAPAELGAESITFQSGSGATVHGWWCPVAASGGAIVLLPGVRANRLSMVDRALFLRRLRYSVLLIDFQATGETKGDHITFGARESFDAAAAVDFVRRTEPSSHIGVIGSSLGGAAALLATPSLRVDAMILEAVYPTIERATSNRLRKYLGPMGPVVGPILLVQLRPRLGISPARLRPIDHIGAVKAPVLIINGAQDPDTTPEDAKLLYEQARAPKELWLVPRAGHVDLYRAAPVDYETHIERVLDRMATGTSDE